ERPATSCSAFGRSDFILVPSPAARTIASALLSVGIRRPEASRCAKSRRTGLLRPGFWQIRAAERKPPRLSRAALKNRQENHFVSLAFLYRGAVARPAA